MRVIKYTDREGGEWIEPRGCFTKKDVFSFLPHKTDEGWLWGFIHSFVTEYCKRYDAYNDGYYKGRKISRLLT